LPAIGAAGDDAVSEGQGVLVRRVVRLAVMLGAQTQMPRVIQCAFAA
jgi:hypothetical protein